MVENCVFSLAPPLLAVTAFAIVLRAILGPKIRLTPIFLALGLLILNVAALIFDSWIQPHIVFTKNLDYNWIGKAIAVLTSLVMIVLIAQINPQKVGLTWRQRTGSVRPALVIVLLLFIIACVLGFVSGNGTDTKFSHVAYQATMPGLDEELFDRGVLLALFLQGFGDAWRSESTVLLGPAALAVTFLFGAEHGFRFSDDGFRFSLLEFIVPGFIGFLLLWIRLRTGSIVLGVVAHNLTNVTIFIAQSAVFGLLAFF